MSDMPKRERLIDFLEKLPVETDVGLMDAFYIFIHDNRDRMIEIVKDRYMDCYIWSAKYSADKLKVGIQLCLKNGTFMLIGRENK